MHFLLAIKTVFDKVGDMKLQLPLWYDLHTHLRQDELMAPIIQSHIDMGCCGVLAMPNTKPPVAKVLNSDNLDYWSIESYLDMIKAAGGDTFNDIIVPLYLTKDTTAQMIEQGAKSGLLRAVKYYPPHGTTGADFGVPIADLMNTDIINALEDNDVIMCLHGEQHHMDGADYINRQSSAEEFFYREHMPRLADKHPDLKIVCEHVTTKVAVDFVHNRGKNVAATITPQHLMYTIGHLLQGLKYHLYCLPLLKFTEDRDALRKAAMSPQNTQFFAGTDNAPHTAKATDCGCAAGCFTGGIAPQLYAQAFEMAGGDFNDEQTRKSFENFLCHNGPDFYGLQKPDKTFTLEKTPQILAKTQTPSGDITPLPLGLGEKTIPWSIKL